jgi:hypothetical protein
MTSNRLELRVLGGAATFLVVVLRSAPLYSIAYRLSEGAQFQKVFVVGLCRGSRRMRR